MDRRLVIAKIFNHFFYADSIPEYEISGIFTDKQLYHLTKLINDSTKFDSFKSFLAYGLKDFRDKYLSIDKNSKHFNDDSLAIEKAIITVAYPWYASLDRLNILASLLDENTYRQMIGISIKDIQCITACIILRTHLFATVQNDRDILSGQQAKKVFAHKNPKIWFSANEILALNPNINPAHLKKYFELFSTPLSKLSVDMSSSFLYEDDGKYALIFTCAHGIWVFNHTEQLIIESLSCEKNGLEQYKLIRGKALEEYVSSMIHSVFITSYKNLYYVDLEQKKRELDILAIDGDMILIVECKSSYFDVSNSTDDKQTAMRVMGAFGNSLKSINAFHKFVQNKDSVTLYTENRMKEANKIEIDILNKKLVYVQVTLYPLDFIGPNLHIFDALKKDNFEVFPIITLEVNSRK